MAFIGLYKFDLALRNEGIRWSFIRWARKVLQINFEECRTVLIHTSDKRPSHSLSFTKVSWLSMTIFYRIQMKYNQILLPFIRLMKVDFLEIRSVAHRFDEFFIVLYVLR